MEFKYCYIFDFVTGSIHCLHLDNSPKPTDEYEDCDELIRDWGFNPNNIQYMITEDKIEINHIEKPIK